jgi:hypothetical protein
MHKYRPILVALLLLSLSVKALAFGHAACQLQEPSGSVVVVMDSGMMDHSQHADLPAPLMQDSAVDCCADCDCPSGNCGSALLAAAEPISDRFTSSPPGDFTRLITSRMTHFLFRPPITL